MKIKKPYFCNPRTKIIPSLSFNYFPPPPLLFLSLFFERTKFFSSTLKQSSSSLKIRCTFVGEEKKNIEYNRGERDCSKEAFLFLIRSIGEGVTVYRERSKILGRDGCTDGLRALSSFSATLADQRRLPDSVNRSNSTRSTDISGLKRALLRETRARPLSWDRLPSIKLPHPSTKSVPFSKQVASIFFGYARKGWGDVQESKQQCTTK